MKIKKYGSCKSIMISEIANKKPVMLIQNAFPMLEKYIDHIHPENGATVIDKIKEKMLNELENDKLHK